jgi:hypothetical protein
MGWRIFILAVFVILLISFRYFNERLDPKLSSENVGGQIVGGGFASSRSTSFDYCPTNPGPPSDVFIPPPQQMQCGQMGSANAYECAIGLKEVDRYFLFLGWTYQQMQNACQTHIALQPGTPGSPPQYNDEIQAIIDDVSSAVEARCKRKLHELGYTPQCPPENDCDRCNAFSYIEDCEPTITRVSAYIHKKIEDPYDLASVFRPKHYLCIVNVLASASGTITYGCSAPESCIPDSEKPICDPLSPNDNFEDCCVPEFEFCCDPAITC